MQTGIIKTVDTTRGLGYIQESNGHEIVLITLGLEDMLAKGLRVNYNIRQTRLGIIAIDVQPVANQAIS